MITIPSDFVSSAMATSGSLFGDFKILIMLALGIVIALGIFAALTRSGGDEDDE